MQVAFFYEKTGDVPGRCIIVNCSSVISFFLPQEKLETHPGIETMVRELRGGFIFSTGVDTAVNAVIPQGGFFEYIFVVREGISQVEIKSRIFAQHFGESAAQGAVEECTPVGTTGIACLVGRTTRAAIKKAFCFQ